MPRRGAVALAVVALGLPVAGCGGAQVAYTEITSAPPTLPIPSDQGGATADASASSTRGSDGVVKSKTGQDATSDTSSATGSTGTSGTTGTTTTPSTTAPAPAATTAPSTGTGTSGTTGGTTPSSPTQAPSSGSGGTGGATADQGLDQFCADNPGACNGGN